VVRVLAAAALISIDDFRRYLVRPMTRSRLLLAVLILIIGACGGDGNAPTGSETTLAGSETTTASPETTGAAEAAGDEPIQVAFVYLGPVGEHGWNFRHDQARVALETEFGDQVETSFLENVAGGPSSERVFDDLARSGVDFVVAAAFDYHDQVVTVAANHPETLFTGPGFYELSANVTDYEGGFEQGAYLGGMAAASLVEADELGILAAFPIPEVLRSVNGYLIGARSINPEATLQVVWTSTWEDPLVEGQAAEALFDTGIKAVIQTTDLTAAGEIAEERGGYWSEIYDDGSPYAPNAYTIGGVYDLDSYVIQTVQQLIDGTFESGVYYNDMANGGIKPGPMGPALDEETKGMLQETIDQMTAGEFSVFTGPLVDQDGNEVLPDSEVADVDFLITMDFLLEGVEGSLPG
jgi:basic membrane lipoprotein Med (substrate-binding protein (PBP1-ABC) superfamily)